MVASKRWPLISIDRLKSNLLQNSARNLASWGSRLRPMLRRPRDIPGDVALKDEAPRLLGHLELGWRGLALRSRLRCRRLGRRAVPVERGEDGIAADSHRHAIIGWRHAIIGWSSRRRGCAG